MTESPKVEGVQRPPAFRPRTAYLGHQMFGQGDSTVLVEPETARQLREAAKQARLGETGGLLFGRTWSDDDGPYVLVDGFVQAGPETRRPGGFRLPETELGQLRAEADHRYPTADEVGWWHSHAEPGSFTPADHEMHRGLQQPHGVGLLVFGAGQPWATAYLGPGATDLGPPAELTAAGRPAPPAPDPQTAPPPGGTAPPTSWDPPPADLAAPGAVGGAGPSARGIRWANPFSRDAENAGPATRDVQGTSPAARDTRNAGPATRGGQGAGPVTRETQGPGRRSRPWRRPGRPTVAPPVTVPPPAAPPVSPVLSATGPGGPPPGQPPQGSEPTRTPRPLRMPRLPWPPRLRPMFRMPRLSAAKVLAAIAVLAVIGAVVGVVVAVELLRHVHVPKPYSPPGGSSSAPASQTATASAQASASTAASPGQPATPASTPSDADGPWPAGVPILSGAFCEDSPVKPGSFTCLVNVAPSDWSGHVVWIDRNGKILGTGVKNVPISVSAPETIYVIAGSKSHRFAQLSYSPKF